VSLALLPDNWPEVTMDHLDGQARKAFRSPAEGRPTSTETGRSGLNP
jgi:hypothetical protein